MTSLSISKKNISWIKTKVVTLDIEWFVTVIAGLASVIAIIYSYRHGYIVSYGDAESHLNIAKRVVDSLTPGFAQLGGIWLPLPHLFLLPFVYSDFLWRTGLAGSFVSGISFVISAIYIYKLARLITKHRGASFVAALVFILNFNVLYLQTTPMTELVLIVFFILSSYYFILFLDSERVIYLIFAALFGFCASLSRYDGWSLVLMEAGVLFLFYVPYRFDWKKFSVVKKYREKMARSYGRLEGRLILFSTLALFGIVLWLLWGFLILGDPLYFTHSQFSAKSQQQSWLARGELPGYQHLLISIMYYFFTGLSNAGVVTYAMAIVGIIMFLLSKENKHRLYILLIMLVPFIFNVLTLYLGQSVIFLPSITPISFEWRLFNVRYGVMMIPFVALGVGYLFYRSKIFGRILIVGLFAFQIALYGIGYSHVITLQDGTFGLSSATAKVPDAQLFIEHNYDHGMILTDDFARTISIIRTSIPMKSVIYIGNKPYWEESLVEPEKYARWIVMQKDDVVWNSILGRPEVEARLFKYFNKVYTSEDVLIFRRIENS